MVAMVTPMIFIVPTAPEETCQDLMETENFGFRLRSSHGPDVTMAGIVGCASRRPILSHFGQMRRFSAMQPVKFGSDIPGYIVGDKGKPAVILIQEWWGVTDGIKEKAVKVAEKGNYRVLVPDLYKGKVGVDVEEASHMMGSLDFLNAVKEIQEAASFLKSEGHLEISSGDIWRFQTFWAVLVSSVSHMNYHWCIDVLESPANFAEKLLFSHWSKVRHWTGSTESFLDRSQPRSQPLIQVARKWESLGSAWEVHLPWVA